MKNANRRRFLKLASGGLLGAAGVAVVESRSTRLDRSYLRPCNPSIEVRYPASWYLKSHVLSDLRGPGELFYLSNRPIPRHKSIGESGQPDLTLFPEDTLLIRLLGYPEREAVHHGWASDRRSAAEGVRLDHLIPRDNWPPGFEHRSQWYAGSDEFGYAVGLWRSTRQGGQPGDLETAKAILESVRLQ